MNASSDTGKFSGGIARIARAKQKEIVKDVDIIPLDFPDTTNPNRETKIFRSAINTIAKTYRLRRDWMNDVVAAFTPSLPPESLMLWRDPPQLADLCPAA